MGLDGPSLVSDGIASVDLDVQGGQSCLVGAERLPVQQGVRRRVGVAGRRGVLAGPKSDGEFAGADVLPGVGEQHGEVRHPDAVVDIRGLRPEPEVPAPAMPYAGDVVRVRWRALRLGVAGSRRGQLHREPAGLALGHLELVSCQGSSFVVKAAAERDRQALPRQHGGRPVSQGDVVGDRGTQVAHGLVDAAARQGGHAERVPDGSEARHAQAGHDRQVGVRLQLLAGLGRHVLFAEEVGRFDDRTDRGEPAARLRNGGQTASGDALQRAERLPPFAVRGKGHRERREVRGVGQADRR
ncbi:hypothetical protein MPTA5024_01875 [Microbispora sp. ATCC PTA-5024]|nr:hypothetical protein MPTA5024_01875 [Microbispora sp. ATCC PTA-5024]